MSKTVCNLLSLVVLLAGLSTAQANVVISSEVDTATEWSGSLVWDGTLVPKTGVQDAGSAADRDAITPSVFQNLPGGGADQMLDIFEFEISGTPFALISTAANGVPDTPTRFGATAGGVSGQYSNGYNGGVGGGIVNFALTADFSHPTTRTATFSFTAIPEPGAWLLMACVLGMVVASKRLIGVRTVFSK